MSKQTFKVTSQTPKATRALADFTDNLKSGALNTAGIKMESINTTADTVGGGVLAAIKATLKEGGFHRFAQARTKVIRPGDHLRTSVKLEDANEQAEGETVNEETQNLEFTTPAQERAGVIAAAMADQPAEWAQAALEATNDAQNHTNNTEDGVEFAERVKLEAYDDANFRDAVGYSVVWNVVSARQSNAVENVWPCLVLEPNQSHVEAVVQFQTFQQEFRHKPTGDVIDPGRVLLMEAIIDGSILDENIIKIVPVYEDGVSDKHFIDPTIIAHKQVIVEGEEVTTGPLTIGEEHNLIGLGAAAIAGLTQDPNTATQLAPMPRLENIYLQITNKTDQKSVIKIDATTLARSSFTAAPEGNTREIQLNFQATQLGLDGNTVDVTGAPAQALAFLRQAQYTKHRLEFSLKVYGSGNLEYGQMEINAAKGKLGIVKVQQGLGHFTKEKDNDVVTALHSEIKSIELIAFDPDASRTNIDRRQRGPLTNVTAQREKYYVRLGSPISTIFPATEATSNIDLIAPMTATRIKNDYYGIKALFRNAETLSGIAVSYENDLARAETKAIGRYIMMPYYRHVRISMLDIVDSNRSKNKLEDAQHAFLNYVRDIIIHAMRDSKYELALQVQTGNAEAKPTLAMITNQVLGKYLFQLGDTRILGSLPYPVVADTHASNLLGNYGSDEHEMFIVPTLPGTQMNALNFGHFLWKPELASTLQVTRDGSTSRELVVQPCCEWHMTCPFMIRITVTDMTHVMTSKTPLAILV